ncbi:MAG: radical SAM/SPASM domain-containing protein [Thermoprotei archaeon]|nr:MAG: radical SAM/SPASM domain-containing protein [Thermoprotei archaeon]RLF19026.1 MAG: radical SAM/SPASM domain-containing protein [Thermoprotei archaeon]
MLKRRGGMSALFATFISILGNPGVRVLLRLACKEVSCMYGNKERKESILYHTLSLLASDNVTCPIGVRFLSEIINGLIRTGVAIMGGDIKEVKRSLKDPALRRGVALVFRGIAHYGITVPQKLPAPFLIVWNFTNMCNLKCKHCYQRAEKPLPDELTLEEKLRIVDELDKAGVAAVALSGGEPTIHPHFLQIVKALSEREIYVAVATNGWKFADYDFLRRAKEAGLRYVEVSVDSANPKRHDWFRGVDGSWERAVKALENAVKLDMSHAMAVTITKFNLNEVKDILDLAESIGVRRVVFFNFIPVGRGVAITNLDLDPVEREKFLRKAYKEMKRRGLEIEVTAPQYSRVVLQLSGKREISPTHFYTGADPAIRALAQFIGGCGAGRIYAGIQPNGDLIPCVFMPIKVGNLRESRFIELWNNALLLRKLRNRDNLWGFCKVCPYRNICGGCRARAYSYFGDPLGPDPGCIYNMKYWNEILKAQEKEIEAI